ncbi:MAG: glycosyltransferase family 4 protein [Candidatus Sericytochromatia bacterium]|nr:glycosyltransferase family 4 protein [Candidatus Sericytochromatia bacterium]
MRIAMLAPICESTPPRAYGGIERVAALLVDGLVSRGHHVTLYATGNSLSHASELSATEELPLRVQALDPWMHEAATFLHLVKAVQGHDAFDIWHNHHGYPGLALGELVNATMLTTVHGPIFSPHARYYQAFGSHPLVTISHAQRLDAPHLNYVANVYNGIETARYDLGLRQDYLLFLGRMAEEKGPHLAIEAAHQAGLPLVMAAKVDPSDRAYFETRVAPHIDGTSVRFVGEVQGAAKRRLLQGALALLHLVQWPEPFGLVLVEAMACGTPVVAMRQGAIPEVVTHGETGFVVETLAEAVEAIACVSALDPKRCRDEAKRRFDVARMVSDYERVYEEIASRRVTIHPRVRSHWDA